MSKQYQSFPGAEGDSNTLEKLKALHFPSLEGKSFLDVGCNEGFFCGFAKFIGASRVVGIDFSAEFIRRARIRFPDCEFLEQSWDVLPDEKFDVILMASAIHYADDQPRMIRRLVDKLTPHGILILETGIVQSNSCEWIEVKRSIDTRKFPTRTMLQQELENLSIAWKWMGHSVSQAGDPIPRYVLHLSNKKPIAYLLLQPSGYGKTYLSQILFNNKKIQLIHGDQKIIDVANGHRIRSESLENLIKKQYAANTNIALLITMIMSQNLIEELVDLWFFDCPSGDVLIDSFIPIEFHEKIVELIKIKGYMVVQLLWDNVIETERGGRNFLNATEKYFNSLDYSINHVEKSKIKQNKFVISPKGYVDRVIIDPVGVYIKGWAVDAAGLLPSELAIRIGSTIQIVNTGQAQSRPDVKKHLSIDNDQVGFNVFLTVPDSFKNFNVNQTNFSVAFTTGELLTIGKSAMNQLQDLQKTKPGKNN